LRVCVNLSVEVASVAMVELCRDWSALCLDTCIEPWADGYTDPSLSVTEQSYTAYAGPRALQRAGTPTRPR
jgi:homospermidine synthase